MEIKGKTAIVTGAAAGIGRASALAIAEAGAKGVTIADIDDEGLAETKTLIEATGAQALALHIDVTSLDDLQRMYDETVSKWGRVDIVHNNAGIVSGPPPYPDSAFEKIRLVIEIDLVAVINSTTIAIRQMRDNGGGVVINTASTAALNPLPNDAQYAAAKAGVVHFGTSCEVFAEQYGVRVNTVCPGVVETPILDKTGGGKRPDWLAPILEQIRILEPEDIADAVLELIRDDEMAGQHIVIENEPVEVAA